MTQPDRPLPTSDADVMPAPFRLLSRPPRLVLAEDDDMVRWVLRDLFQGQGFDVSCLPDGFQLLTYLERGPLLGRADAVVTDLRMPGMTGLEALDLLGDQRGDVPVFLITAFADAPLREEAASRDVVVFDKPIDLQRLEADVRSAICARGPAWLT